MAPSANGLSVRTQVQKALRFVCCWFFLETCGFVTSATIHWPVLLYCLILSRVEENCFWQQNANIFLQHKHPSGALFFSLCPKMIMRFIRSSTCFDYLLSLLTGQKLDFCMVKYPTFLALYRNLQGFSAVSSIVIQLLTVSPHIMFSFVHWVIMACQ